VSFAALAAEDDGPSPRLQSKQWTAAAPSPKRQLAVREVAESTAALAWPAAGKHGKYRLEQRALGRRSGGVASAWRVANGTSRLLPGGEEVVQAVAGLMVGEAYVFRVLMRQVPPPPPPRPASHAGPARTP
jgi:hypothetical protein